MKKCENANLAASVELISFKNAVDANPVNVHKLTNTAFLGFFVHKTFRFFDCLPWVPDIDAYDIERFIYWDACEDVLFLV